MGVAHAILDRQLLSYSSLKHWIFRALCWLNSFTISLTDVVTFILFIVFLFSCSRSEMVTLYLCTALFLFVILLFQLCNYSLKVANKDIMFKEYLQSKKSSKLSPHTKVRIWQPGHFEYMNCFWICFELRRLKSY